MDGILAMGQAVAVVAAPLVVALLCLYARYRRIGRDELLLWAFAHLALALVFLLVQLAPSRADIAAMGPAWRMALFFYTGHSWLMLFGVLAMDGGRISARTGLLAAAAIALLSPTVSALAPDVYLNVVLWFNPLINLAAALLLLRISRSLVFVIAGVVMLLRAGNGFLYVSAVQQAGQLLLPDFTSPLAIFSNFLSGVSLLAVVVETAWIRLNAALAEARDARQESDAILDMAPISILRKDVERRVVRASRYALALAESYGATREEVIGARSEDVMPQPASNEMMRMDQRLLGDPATGPLESEVSFTAPDGRPITLLVRKIAVADDSGTPTGVISASLDISNLKQIEARLREQIQLSEQASKAKSDFLANMSHELRTPLNGISGFAEMMAAGYLGPLNERQKEYLDNIMTSSHNMLALVSRILDLSRLDAGAVALQRKPVDLGAIVADVLADAAPMATECGIAIESRLIPAVASVDPVAMRQVVSNLVSNAIRFNRSGGKVSIEMRQHGGRSVIVIADTGIGMTPAQIAAAGDPFLRNDPLKSRPGGGAGLGLAISRTLIELHGGDLVIASVSDGGTTVTLSL
ncbi:MAG: HAMP domain-containing sensor histidine kinase [Ferrovibrio sp.]